MSLWLLLISILVSTRLIFLEHYVQEIGRAGQDGRQVTALALVLSNDVQLHLSLSHSNGMTKCQIKCLLLIFQERVQDSLAEVEYMEGGASSNTIDIEMPIAALLDSTDCKAENINTIFSLLEDDDLF